MAAAGPSRGVWLGAAVGRSLGCCSDESFPRQHPAASRAVVGALPVSPLSNPLHDPRSAPLHDGANVVQRIAVLYALEELGAVLVKILFSVSSIQYYDPWWKTYLRQDFFEGLDDLLFDDIVVTPHLGALALVVGPRPDGV